MKTCTIHGDMSSDSAADQYPTVTLCDDCAADTEAAEQMVNSDGYDPSFGVECSECGKTPEEEADKA